jgi:large subunit ribosomal protein L34
MEEVDKTISLFCDFQKKDLFAILSFMEKFVTLKKVKRKRKHGFLIRMRSHGGEKVIARRRAKNRKMLAIE